MDYSLWGHKELDMTERVRTRAHTHTHNKLELGGEGGFLNNMP